MLSGRGPVEVGRAGGNSPGADGILKAEAIRITASSIRAHIYLDGDRTGPAKASICHLDGNVRLARVMLARGLSPLVQTA